MSKTRYDSDIVLGERYIDEQSGYEGVANAIYFFQHGCERVCLETYDAERLSLRTETFDAPRLKSVKTGKVAATTRTGGNQMPVQERNREPR